MEIVAETILQRHSAPRPHELRTNPEFHKRGYVPLLIFGNSFGMCRIVQNLGQSTDLA